jgi:hypothetical protein
MVIDQIKFGTMDRRDVGKKSTDSAKTLIEGDFAKK